MAKQKIKIQKIIREYIHLISKEIKVDKVVLFGSHAWGNPRPDSDIDIAVFSPQFKDKEEMNNLKYLFKRACSVDCSIEPLAYHTKNYKNPDKRTLLYKIIKYGKEIQLP